ncbi:hypothetical protein [Campylobacter sp. RM12651]|uniref:hypothetical protein n=1 Tax=Campylobacter sp. RM12651 TaxID=1660079 RepID=UPI001EFB414E|nr:hypothetical protein [Campylobacter sp. RM12651]ULO03809.1 hypothetical protein AVBRAN_1355 [Campylobacter sp. RM12651]
MFLSKKEIDKLILGVSCINIKDSNNNKIIEIYDDKCYFIYNECDFKQIRDVKDLKKVSINANSFLNSYNVTMQKEKNKIFLIINTDVKHIKVLADQYYQILDDICGLKTA